MQCPNVRVEGDSLSFLIITITLVISCSSCEQAACVLGERADRIHDWHTTDEKVTTPRQGSPKLDSSPHASGSIEKTPSAAAAPKGNVDPGESLFLHCCLTLPTDACIGYSNDVRTLLRICEAS